MDRSFVEQVVAAAASVVASGAISANGHGNVSLHVPGADEMYYPAAPSLRGLGPDGVVRVALDRTPVAPEVSICVPPRPLRRAAYQRS